MVKYIPSKKVANRILAYLASVLYLIEACLMVCTFVGLVTGKLKVCLVSVIIFVILLAVLVTLSLGFSWVKYYTLEVNNGKLIYKYYDVIDTFGKDESICTITELKELKVSKKSLIIVGDIFVKEPMSKEKKYKTIELKGYNDEVLNFIKEFAKK